ncbi:MAG TPA: DNA-formamidopyrimidine glycosylase family protein, partial [Actinomycetota bacterium]|nr:DNA-formamidopyrimidine glycosylase family protein [Actinomycetota bacterium]
MPELPEAERAREALERHALGRVVADADDSDSYVCRPWPPGGLREALVGHKVTGIDRVGKQLLVETDGPVLGLHLGMSGSLRFDDDPGLRFKRFALAFTDGTTMVLRDPRRLGRVTL